jgi:hypothetical protein
MLYVKITNCILGFTIKNSDSAHKLTTARMLLKMLIRYSVGFSAQDRGCLQVKQRGKSSSKIVASAMLKRKKSGR